MHRRSFGLSSRDENRFKLLQIIIQRESGKLDRRNLNIRLTVRLKSNVQIWAEFWTKSWTVSWTEN